MANFVATPAVNIEEFEPGRIMVLQGLNKTELNGVHVEVLKKAQNGDSENIRWTCIIVDETVVHPPLNVKALNLGIVPLPSAETLEIAAKLCMDGQQLYRTKNGVAKAKNKLIAALALYPCYGFAYCILGEIAHYTKKSQVEIMTYMRRAVANCLDTEADRERVFFDRFGYSGALGNMGRYDEEQQQLRACLSTPCISEFPNCDHLCTSLLADSIFQQGNPEEAMNILLSYKRNHPVLGSFRGANIDDRVQKTLLRISYHFYKIASEIEKQGDQAPDCSEEKKALYERAKVGILKAKLAGPNDLATIDAWMRIQAELSTNPTCNPIELETLRGGIMTSLNISVEPT